MRTFYAFLSCSILACLGLTTAPSAQAQEVIYDSVVLGEGNANMSFYSLANGELAQVPLADWHIALDVRAMGSTARINGGLGLKLYPYGSLAEWDNVDLTTWVPGEPYRNNQTDWSNAAFSQGGDGMFDLGWGVYDVVTHIVTSDVMYLVQLPDQSWKKLALLSLSSGVYDVQFANLDGTDFFNVSVNKADYDGQLFAYCNLLTGSVEDLEPTEPWDIAFFTYEDEIAPGTYYPVTGGLIHPNVAVQQVEKAWRILSSTVRTALIPSRLKPMPLATIGSPLCPVKATPSKRSDATSSRIHTATCGAWSSLVLAVRPPVKSTLACSRLEPSPTAWPKRQLNPFDSTPIRWHQGNH